MAKSTNHSACSIYKMKRHGLIDQLTTSMVHLMIYIRMTVLLDTLISTTVFNI